MRSPLRGLFCGEGLALSAVIEHALGRDHRLAGIFATSPSEARVLRRSESRVSRPSDTPAKYAPGPPYEVLLSVNNGRLLKTRIDHYGHVRYDRVDLGWGRWTGRRVATSWMPGDHLGTATQASASEFAALLRAADRSAARPLRAN